MRTSFFKFELVMDKTGWERREDVRAGLANLKNGHHGGLAGRVSA